MTLCLFAYVTAGLSADDVVEIRSVLRSLNKALREGDAQVVKKFFTSTADYRDATRSVAGAVSIASLFSNDQVWSERTPPLLKQRGIRMIGVSAALVDAEVIQYGSTVLKSSVPVVLVLENEAGTWKISSWRMSGCASYPPI